MAAAAVVATVSVGKMLGVKQDDSESFTLRVNAKEMKRADQVDVPDDYVYDVSLSGDDGDAVTYDTSFPITCKGKNIRTVTYSIQGAIFTVTNPINERIVIDGQKPDEDLWIPAGYNGMSKVKKEAHQYKSFTVDYKRQESENTLISIDIIQRCIRRKDYMIFIVNIIRRRFLRQKALRKCTRNSIGMSLSNVR